MILALKTAGADTDLYLRNAEGQTLSSVQWASGRRLSDELLAKIQELLSQHDAALKDLTGIIIFSGPGSFTSLRIGHAVANGLADSLGIPVTGAQGDGWLEAGAKALAQAQPGRPALPFYGAEANITKPKS
jgi:tRNA threonylcarbamoyladenosine biosynthesis protein TsaB